MEKRTQQILSAALPTNRLADGSPQILNILWNKVSQIRILGAIPYLLHRIKIRRVRRQPFHINATAESSLQPFGAAAMNHPVIHNHDKPSWKMREQLCHKCLKIIGDNVAIMQGKIQSQAFAFGRNSDRGDGRESVSAVPTVMDGSLSSRSPSSSNSWLKHKAAFIQQNKGFAASLGFFLYGANQSFARWLWPARLVRGLCVRAFGNSSPFVSTHAKCWTVRSERQNACKLSRPHVSVSIARWSNRFCGPLSRAAFLIAGFFLGESRFSSRRTVSLKSLLAMGFVRFSPLGYSTAGYPNQSSGLANTMALFQQRNGLSPTLLQLFGCSYWSHT